MVKKKSKMAKKEVEVAKKEPKVTTSKVGLEEKHQAVKASDELAKYLADNHLDPTKDWTQDPKHGKKIRKLMQVVRVNREKLEDKVDEVKIKNLRKPKINKDGEKVEKQPTSYDYPEVDGKPMDSLLKKKFRTKMRNLLKSQMDPKEASKRALEAVLHSEPKPAKPAKEEKAEKVEEKETPAPKKEKKDKKKVKEEKVKVSKKDKKDKKKSHKEVEED